MGKKNSVSSDKFPHNWDIEVMMFICILGVNY